MNPDYRAFVIDDDGEVRRSLDHLLNRAGWGVTAFSNGEAALNRLATEDPDVIVSDLRMPGLSGLDVLDRLEADAAPPLVLISAHGDIPLAVEAIQRGAYSFLEKPFEPRTLLRVVKHAAESHRLKRLARRMQDDLLTLSGIDRVLLGQDQAIVALRQQILDLGQSSAPVLIEGETGTGKELVARALHRLGVRRSGDFVPVNCALLEADRFEDILFGREAPRRGLYQKASAGTLFLDEVAACPLTVQAKLLRVLEDGEAPFSDTETNLDVRILAATNEDLAARVEGGQFRRDLYYRLNAFRLALPPLAARGNDVILMFRHFLEDLAQTYEIAAPEVTAADTSALLSHGWPGNVRELRHVAERRVLAARRGGGSVPEALGNPDPPDDMPGTLREAVARFERSLISQAIRAHRGRMDAVAEALGIGRRTLNEKIVKLGLDKGEALR